ncbi:MAG: alpha/beta hydrolase [Chloroflexi bacterium]|nr:alpha/beta hydrolase [Chloroflexota bacterium]
MRYLSLLVTFVAAAALVNPRSGMLHFFFWPIKLLATALSPLLTVVSWLLALQGRRRGDKLLMGLGVAGTAAALHHFADITRPRETALIDAFGPEWDARIPVVMRARFTPCRWRPLVWDEPVGRVQRHVVYGFNPDVTAPLVADILRPPLGVAPSGLAMIFVHGGAWRYGRRNITKFPYFRQLASQGHLIMDIDYTLNPHTSLPGMVMDVKRAILWLKEHAAEYELNPERIVLTGQSAGGHLALLAAYTPNYRALQPRDEAGQVLAGDTAVRAVISYYGPPDMVALHEDFQKRFETVLSERVNGRLNRILQRIGEDGWEQGLSALVGGPLADIPEMYRLISPITYVDADCPPTMLLHGTHDVLVDHEAAARLSRALHLVGVPVVYLPLPGCEHSFESVLPRISPAAQTAVYYMERFLALVV